jgi:alpha-beta hydrolase superfamily lysophospholipase
MEEIAFSSEGCTLRGCLRESEGSPGRAVLLCHGAFEFQDHWADYAERMQQAGISTFIFDFTGHGGSEGLRSLVDLKAWAYNIRDAVSALAARGYQEFALVGWGIGGSAALLAAAHDPRLRCAVILSAPVSLIPGIGERLAYGVISLAARIISRFTKKPLSLSRLNELEEMRVSLDEEVNQAYFSNPKLREAYQAVPVPESLDSVWFDITQSVEKITVPVLVIHGREDEIVPVSQSEKLVDKLQGQKKLTIIEGAGHALHLESQNEIVFEIILKWIRKYLDPAGKNT